MGWDARGSLARSVSCGLALLAMEAQELLIEFLSAACHLVLYERAVYPQEIFERRQLFNVNVVRSRHRELNVSRCGLNLGPAWVPRPRRGRSLRSSPSPLRSLLASSPTAALLALATALTPGFAPLSQDHIDLVMRERFEP